MSTAHWKDFQSFEQPSQHIVEENKGTSNMERISKDEYSKLAFGVPFSELPERDKFYCEDEYQSLMGLTDEQYEGNLAEIKKDNESVSAKQLKKADLSLDMYSEMMYEAPFSDIPAKEQVDCKEEYDTLMLMEDAEFQDAMEAVKNPYSAAAVAYYSSAIEN
jgi:hypothetical protein